MELSRFGLRTVRERQDNAIAWSDYVAWSRDSRVWLVWQSNQLVQFIPARALTPEAGQVFEGLVGHLPRRCRTGARSPHRSCRSDQCARSAVCRPQSISR